MAAGLGAELAPPLSVAAVPCLLSQGGQGRPWPGDGYQDRGSGDRVRLAGERGWTAGLSGSWRRAHWVRSKPGVQQVRDRVRLPEGEQSSAERTCTAGPLGRFGEGVGSLPP